MNYSIYLSTETEKYDFMRAARDAGATVTGVSGCGTGYYIQIDATTKQADFINKIWYRPEIHTMTAEQIRAAWCRGELTVGQVTTWQERHGEVL